MTSVNEIFPRVQKLKYDLQQQLREVEAKRMPPADMELGLDALRKQYELLEMLAEKEVHRREEWRQKILDVKEAHSWLVQQLQRWRQHHDREALEEAERRELFGQYQLPSSVMSALSEEGDSYMRSSNRMAGLLESAGSSLTELTSQREMLKGTQRKVLDMLTTLGVSSSTIRIIERRNVVDKMIVYGGMLITALLLYLVHRWIKGGGSDS